MTEKRQTSQDYIIRILQHFATKLWNITNFVMLFQAVMKFLSTQVVNSQILPKPNKFHVTHLHCELSLEIVPWVLSVYPRLTCNKGFCFFRNIIH